MGSLSASGSWGQAPRGRRRSLRSRARPRPGALLAAGLLAAALLWPAPVAGEGPLYAYEDDRGVLHFTNVPTDPRYERREAPPPGSAPGRRRLPGAYDRLIASAAERARIPPALVKAVVHAESAFDPRAVSPKGAMGLMQLMPATAAALGVAEPFHATQNVHGGARYLQRLHRRYGSWTWALAAYNAGPRAVDRYRGVPPYAETRAYVRRVLSYYRRYHGDFGR